MKIYRYKGKCNLSGERIRAMREKRGLSQEQLAARMQLAGVQLNQKAISRMEAGERVIADYELLTLAQALSVNPMWLLGEEEVP